MSIRIGIFHTFLYSVNDLQCEFKKQLPEVELINIIEDCMVAEMIKTVSPNPSLIARLATYFRHFQELGCKCILMQCTSAGDAADIASNLIDIPVLKIDYPMAKQAVAIGGRVGIIVTAISTIKPSKHLFERAARELDSTANIEVYYCDGAHEALFQKNDQELHDRIIIETAEKAACENDVLALAQLSMVHLLPRLDHIHVPILTSLESGVGQIRGFLNL